MFKAGEMTGRALKREDEIKEPKRGRRTSDQINNPLWRVCALAWRQPPRRSISCQSAFTSARFGVTESITGKETRQSFSRLAFGQDFASAEPLVSLQNQWDKKSLALVGSCRLVCRTKFHQTVFAINLTISNRRVRSDLSALKKCKRRPREGRY